MKIASPTSSPKISQVEITDETLSSRGGLFFYGRYMENTGFLQLVEKRLADFRKSAKGVEVEKLVKQVLCAFADGRGDSMLDFDALRRDPSQAALLEMGQDQMAGSDMMKRFFRKFPGRKWEVLRPIVRELFHWRLQVERPRMIVLDLDTMVLDNDDALKREGCKPTYKKVKGFQNLQVSWEGRIVDVLFRSGEKHSNHGGDALRFLRKTVSGIRKSYDADVPIVVTMDSGFLDGKILTALEEMKVGYVCSGKLYGSIRKRVESMDEAEFGYLRKGAACWSYVEFDSGLDAWKGKKRRTLYTSLVEEETGQISMPFSRPDCVYYTNLGRCEELDKALWKRGHHRVRSAVGILELGHGRGQSELVHRSLKEFMGREHLPFQRFWMNAAYYLLQVIAHFLFECFRRDVARGGVPRMAYPETMRRKVIDFAAKIIRSGNRTVLKVTRAIWETLDVKRLWERCQAAPVMVT